MNGQALANSGADCFLVDPEALRPFDNGQRLSIKGKSFVLPCVSALLFFCCPSAISWAITAVVVWVTIQGMTTAWGAPHIGKETLKGSSPRIADGNATATVPGVVPVPLVVAPLIHHLPDSEFSCLCFPVGGASFAMQTAARLGNAGSQTSAKNNAIDSADAVTIPCNLAGVSASIRNYRPAAKRMAREIRTGDSRH